MSREVDRLLAQLASSGSPAPVRNPWSSPGGPRRTPRASSRPTHSRAEIIGLWARVALGALLGALVTQWPYPRGFGIPLAGYLGAVAAVLVAGTWIAAVSWQRRSAATHVVAFLLLLWGIALAAERVLPRVGYAAERASWTCPVISSYEPAPRRTD